MGEGPQSRDKGRTRDKNPHFFHCKPCRLVLDTEFTSSLHDWKETQIQDSVL